MPIAPQVRSRIAALLGREPRGLEAVAVTGADGGPRVIRVASLVDDTPFPTLFWLVDPVLNYRIDRTEAGGLIRQLQARIDADPALQQQMRADHRAHIALRESYISAELRQRFQDLGFGDVLADRGIGGIADFSRIRCLHTWYAAHLVVANTVGGMLDDWWRQEQAAGAADLTDFDRRNTDPERPNES